jgi:ABC-type Fe3+-siderophore transport system permease subunit
MPVLIIPGPSGWESQCFASAAIFGAGVIAVVSPTIARRAGATTRRGVLVSTVLVGLVFLVILAVFFWTIDPCAQGPA